MIVFDLRCGGGHVFEAWFGAGADYEDQRARGLLECPVCGDKNVGKAAMAAAVPVKGGSDALPPERIKALIGRIAAAQREALAKSDYVGDRFASEARAIHLGEADARSIHGRATRADAEALVEEGVPVAPLLLPVVPPRQEN